MATKFGRLRWAAMLTIALAPLTGSDEASAEDVNVRTRPVTITATKNPITTFEYPGSVTVIDQQEIDERIPSTIDDVIEGVPNTTSAGGPRRNGESPIIRGFSNQDVIVLLDGTRQNFNSAHDGRFFLDPSLLKQVEVVRGAGSALYGSGGLGGVMEVRTKDASDYLAPGESFGANVFFGAQSVNGEISPGITLFGAPSENLDLVGSFIYRDSGDIELGNGAELDADDDIISGMAKATFTEGPHSLEGAWIRYDASAIEPNNAQTDTDTDFADKDILSQTWRATYGYSDPDNDWVNLDATVYFTQFEVDEERLDGPDEGEDLKRDVDTYGLRFDNRSKVEIDTENSILFTYGIDAFRDVQDGDADGGDREGVPDADSNSIGIFLQSEVNVAAPFGMPGDFLIIPGVRFDYYDASSDLSDKNVDTAVSPKIGVSYLPTDWLMFYGSYAHAFSAPNINDLYLTGVHFEIPLGPPFGTVVNRFVPNPDLKPQRTKTIEAGAGFQFEDVLAEGDDLHAKGGWFLTYGKDFISRTVDQPALFVDCNPAIPGDCDGTTIIDNVNRAKLDGVEVEAGYENDFMIFDFAYSHINGIDRDTGDTLGLLQPDTWALHAAAKLGFMDTQIGWRTIIAEKFEDTGDPSADRDGYTLHDIYAIWRPSFEPIRGLSLSAGIDNLFDEAYTRVWTGAYEAGRDYKGWISYTLAW
ncbi:MAG: TonB-dependent receptor [Dongiaceae bacterium]